MIVCDGDGTEKGKGGVDQVVDHGEVIDLGHVSQLLLGMHVGHWRDGSFSDMVLIILASNYGKVGTFVRLLFRFG